MTKLDYSKFVELDDITLEDCYNLYDNKGITIILHDGRIVNLVKE